jgi:hypothetical protein
LLVQEGWSLRILLADDRRATQSGAKITKSH